MKKVISFLLQEKLGLSNVTVSRSICRKRNARPAQRRFSTALTVELLEDRTVPAIVTTSPITDMTQLASYFPQKQEPTKLYLNFDGYSDQMVSAFAGTTDDWERDVQEILFRTAQIFSPFNVQVQRIYGNGNMAKSNGNTTIFIGDKWSNNFWYENKDGIHLTNKAYAFIPSQYADYPGQVKGYNHQPNSNPYGVAYIDPVSFTYSGGTIHNYSTWDNARIARAVAHEAGHSFGLAHVLTGSIPEVMSYTATNSRFRNVTFEVTDLNFNGTTTESNPALAPVWLNYIPLAGKIVPMLHPIVTQNSYTYLQTTLGPRDVGTNIANVADPLSVDPTFQDGKMPSITLGSWYLSAIDWFGDYDVFNLTIGATQFIEINVTDISAGNDAPNWWPDLNPIIMVFNSSGQQLLHYSGIGDESSSSVVFQALGGTSYKIVIGAHDNAWVGNYFFTVDKAVFQIFAGAQTDLPLATKTRDHDWWDSDERSLMTLHGISDADADFEQMIDRVYEEETVRLGSADMDTLLPAENGDDFSWPLDTQRGENRLNWYSDPLQERALSKAFTDMPAGMR